MDDISQYRIQMAHDSLERVRMLRRKRDAAVALAAEFDGIRGIDYGCEPVSASPSDGQLVNLVERRRERKAAMDAAIAEYDGEMHEAWMRIESIGNAYHVQLLAFRYLKGWRWKRIAKKMGFSVDYVKGKLHDSSLLAYYDVMDPNDKVPKSAE